MVGVAERNENAPLGWPRCRQYCNAIFAATSIAVEPSSEKKTRESVLRGKERDEFGGELARRMDW
jgi:hypothetical protein